MACKMVAGRALQPTTAAAVHAYFMPSVLENLRFPDLRLHRKGNEGPLALIAGDEDQVRTSVRIRKIPFPDLHLSFLALRVGGTTHPYVTDSEFVESRNSARSIRHPSSSDLRKC